MADDLKLAQFMSMAGRASVEEAGPDLNEISGFLFSTIVSQLISNREGQRWREGEQYGHSPQDISDVQHWQKIKKSRE